MEDLFVYSRVCTERPCGNISRIFCLNVLFFQLCTANCHETLAIHYIAQSYKKIKDNTSVIITSYFFIKSIMTIGGIYMTLDIDGSCGSAERVFQITNHQ